MSKREKSISKLTKGLLQTGQNYLKTRVMLVSSRHMIFQKKIPNISKENRLQFTGQVYISIFIENLQELSYSNKGYFEQKQSVHVRYVSVFEGQKSKFLSVYLALLEIPYAIELMKQTTASTLQMQHSLLLELDTVMDEEYT